MPSLKQRLLANFGANTFARVSSVAIQVVSVPVMIGHWGAGLYGEWILLSAIPAYLSMSDIGFGNVAGNEMTMLVAAGERREALRVFQSVNLFTIASGTLAAMILVLTVWLLPLAGWLRIHVLTSAEVRWIVIILGFSSLLNVQEGLFQQSFRAVSKSARGVAAKSAVTLACFGGVMLAVCLGAAPLRVAFVMAAINGAGTLILWRMLRAQAGWIQLGIRHASISTVRRLWWPSFSFMSFPISSLITLQGVLIVIGAAAGPFAVVTFSTARTISRSVLQSLQLINASVWPEISAAFGSRQLVVVRKLHRASCQVSIILCVGATLLVGVFGRTAWNVWTVGKVQTDPVLLNLLLLQMVIGSLWYTSSVVPAATNHHQGIARVILIASALSLVLCEALVKILGQRGAALSLAAGDCVAALFVLRASLSLTDDTVPAFLRSMLDTSWIVQGRRHGANSGTARATAFDARS